MRILLVEDDLRTADFVTQGLEEEGYSVCHVNEGTKGLFKVTTEEFDVIVTDVMMPGMDGFTLIEKLRGKGVKVPILVLSAKSNVDDRVKGLRLGGDDYLVKPFAFTELVARIETLARRKTGLMQSASVQVGDLKLDLIKHKAYRGDEEIFLAPLEFNLLSFMARHQGRVVSRTMIIEQVWEYNFDPGTNVVEARICKLRDKVDKPFDKKLIHTVRGFGYVLEDRG